MNEIFKGTQSAFSSFFSNRRKRRLFYLALICIVALGDYLHSALVRRTFVFYSDIEGNVMVEDRMLHRSQDRETDIRRYVEETLLGPASPGAALLFPRETRLISFMYRDSVVYADFSEAAALPFPDGRDVFKSLFTLNEGIRRNFHYIKDVRLFIGGSEVFFNEFHKIFAKSADNTRTAP